MQGSVPTQLVPVPAGHVPLRHVWGGIRDVPEQKAPRQTVAADLLPQALLTHPTQRSPGDTPVFPVQSASDAQHSRPAPQQIPLLQLPLSQCAAMEQLSPVVFLFRQV